MKLYDATGAIEREPQHPVVHIELPLPGDGEGSPEARFPDAVQGELGF